MSSLTAANWKAIKWYADENELKNKDLIVYPTIRFRNKKNEIVDVQLDHIMAKFKARPRNRKKKVEA